MNPVRYLSSFIPNPSLREKPIVCVMCGYNEQDNITDSLLSLVGKIDKMIFVDKNGALRYYVMPFITAFDIDYYVKPELNLLESRKFAINQTPKGSWVIFVDADEIMLASSSYLRSLIKRNVCYRTQKYVTHKEFNELYAMNDYHPFIMLNDGGIYFAPPKDLPRYRGRAVNLKTVCIENRSWCKSKRHQYYRTNYWRAWQASEYKHLPIEEYILAVNGEIPDDKTVEEWYDWITSKGTQL